MGYKLLFVPIIVIIDTREISSVCRFIRYIGICSAGLILPIGRATSPIPSGRILKGYARKAIAISERIIADACDAVGDLNARKTCAIIERIIADACYAVAYYYARKACTTGERPIADACDVVAYHNTLKV